MVKKTQSKKLSLTKKGVRNKSRRYIAENLKKIVGQKVKIVLRGDALSKEDPNTIDAELVEVTPDWIVTSRVFKGRVHQEHIPVHNLQKVSHIRNLKEKKDGKSRKNS